MSSHGPLSPPTPFRPSHMGFLLVDFGRFLLVEFKSVQKSGSEVPFHALDD